MAGDELVRPIGIIYRRGKELGVTVRRFIELLRAHSSITEKTTNLPNRRQTKHLHSNPKPVLAKRAGFNTENSFFLLFDFKNDDVRTH